MSIHETRFYSNTLKMGTSVQVILPEPKDHDDVILHDQNDRLPVLWLLHGLSDDDTQFVRYTSVERYANEKNVAVVMPQVGRSFYANMTYGPRYWTYLTQELPKRLRFFYPLSDKREDNFVAGISMGGYGAFKWAFNYPKNFAAVASISGVMDLSDFGTEARAKMYDFDLVYKDQQITDSYLDLRWLTNHEHQDKVKDLKVYQAIGNDDFLFNQNKAISEHFKQTFGNNYLFYSGEGSHNWDFWDQQLKWVINWLPVKN